MFKALIGAWFGILLINLTIIGLLIWVIVHFVSKFW